MKNLCGMFTDGQRRSEKFSAPESQNPLHSVSCWILFMNLLLSYYYFCNFIRSILSTEEFLSNLILNAVVLRKIPLSYNTYACMQPDGAQVLLHVRLHDLNEFAWICRGNPPHIFPYSLPIEQRIAWNLKFIPICSHVFSDQYYSM